MKSAVGFNGVLSAKVIRGKHASIWQKLLDILRRSIKS